MAAVLHRTPNLAKYTKIKIPRVVEFINLGLTAYFQFDGQIQQIKEIPMESPFTGVIIEAVMKHLENIILSHIQSE